MYTGARKFLLLFENSHPGNMHDHLAGVPDDFLLLGSNHTGTKCFYFGALDILPSLTQIVKLR
jgi:hypothetical protein